jgi:transcriptional regulator with XRE-family HTH domain
MDGMNAIFFMLVLIFIGTITYLQVKLFKGRTEGFIGSTSSSPGPSTVEVTIRAALDQYLNSELCDVYVIIRNYLGQYLQGDTNPPTKETLVQVEEYLTREITLAPLPCPAFKYPKAKAELEWLVFLNELPTDIGARFVLMAVYAQRVARFYVKNIQTVIDGNAPLPESQISADEHARITNKILLSALPAEGFASIIGICPVSVQDTRRAEAASKRCTMPEDLTHDEIVQSVKNILEEMKKKKINILTEKFIDPNIDVIPFIKDAKDNSNYLNALKTKATDGTLVQYLMESSPMSS